MALESLVANVARLGEYYWTQDGEDRRIKLRNLASNESKKWKSALAEFLRTFAFEHQGKSPDFPLAAAEAVDEYDSDIPGPGFEDLIWEAFRQKIGLDTEGDDDKGTAPNINPLRPTRVGRRKSITSFVSTLNSEDDNYNIFSWARRHLTPVKIGSASNDLQCVRGLGRKIASFFLRDAVAAFVQVKDEFELEPAEYLQPIDIWTRRGAEMLSMHLTGQSRPKRFDGDNREAYKKAAELLVSLSRSAGVRPSLVNAGLWILGAQFAQSSIAFRYALNNVDSSNLRELIQRKVGSYQKKAEVLRETSSALY